MQQYKFTIEGATGAGNTYTTTGTVEAHTRDFIGACENAMRECFQQLTSGRAIFGQPGAGCRGPYSITKMTIEVVTQ